MSRIIKVNALVDALNRYDPEQLVKLRQRYPQQTQILTPGLKLGDIESNSIVVTELAIKTLRATKVQLSNSLVPRLRRRLERAKQLRLIGNLVNAVTSAGLISAVLANSSTFAIITASINFISSVSIIISEYLESPLSGKQNSLQELFEQSVQSLVEIEKIEFQLSVALKIEAKPSNLLELAQKANGLVASIRKIEAIAGYL